MNASSLTIDSQSADRELERRIINTFPAGHYCLPSLLRMLEVRADRRIPTACVTCELIPALLVNPDFVLKHCPRDENLLTLVLHELHHVVLGHTRLFPRPTRLHNIVFDAVINALLSRMMPDPAHTELFRSCYSEDSFPECLLRPVDDWHPDRPATHRPPRACANPALSQMGRLHQRLYAEGCTYDELFAGIEQAILQMEDETSIARCFGILLGDHSVEGEDSSSDGNIEYRSPGLFEELRRLVERWPQPPEPIIGRSWSDTLQRRTFKLPPPNNTDKLLGLLRRLVATHDRDGLRTHDTQPVTVLGPFRNPDRRWIVERALGHPSLLSSSKTEVRKPAPRGRVHVYLDVSGSIGPLIGQLASAVIACREAVHPIIHCFSTVVVEATLTELAAQSVQTTGGTSIECVARHLHQNNVRRAMIISDGYVGTPSASAAEFLCRAKLAVALTPGESHRADFEPFVRWWTVLA